MILTIIYFLLPAALANMTAALSAKALPEWTAPIDFNTKFRGKRVLGDHKTIRGFVFGTIAATLFYILQILLYSSSYTAKDISFIDYSQAPLYLGALLGVGALVGDAVKSFFKRQLNYPPGKSWIPFDQVDWVAGAIIFTSQAVNYSTSFIFGALTLFLIIHIVVKYIGYILKLDSAPL